MIASPVPVPVLLGLAVLSTGCPLATFEAELEEACVRRTGLEIAGAAGATSVVQSYDVDDLGGLRDLLELDAELEFVRFEARATSGVDQLGFVDRANVTIASGDPDATLPSLVVYDCAGDCAIDGLTLSVPATGEHDAAAYIASDSLVVDLEVTGALPASAWTLDVDVCVTGRIALALEP